MSLHNLIINMFILCNKSRRGDALIGVYYIIFHDNRYRPNLSDEISIGTPVSNDVLLLTISKTLNVDLVVLRAVKSDRDAAFLKSAYNGLPTLLASSHFFILAYSAGQEQVS